MKSVASVKFIDKNNNLSFGLRWLDWEGEFDHFGKSLAMGYAKRMQVLNEIPESAVALQILVGTTDGNGKFKIFVIRGIKTEDWAITKRKV